MSPHAHAVPCVASDTDRARRTSHAARRAIDASRVSAKTTRATTPSASPETASSTRRTNLDGASHPSCLASSSIPRLGSEVCRKGAAAASAIAPATPTCASAARVRRPGSDRATATSTSSSSGTAAGAFTSVPSASTAVASSSCPSSSSASEPTIASATSRSLWPLATDWNTTAGLSPNAAIANASREGRTRRTSRARTAITPRLAATAISRNATMAPLTEPAIRTTSDERSVNSGPYTAGVSSHFGPTKRATASCAKSAGVAT